MTTVIRTVCAHDCPDMCSILAHVEDGRLIRVEGDPDQPFTAGFVCAKVRREPEMVHSAERVRTPLRRTGPKGSGRFAPVSWDEALDELVERWQAIIRADGPLGILGYCYSAHQGQLNRWLPMALFHALGTTRLQPGTICDTCADVGVGGDLRAASAAADPESVLDSDLIVSWSADLVTTDRPRLGEGGGGAAAGRAAGRDRPAAQPHRGAGRLARRANVGTDAALALGMMHVLVARGAGATASTSGGRRWGSSGSSARCCRGSRPTAWPQITGVSGRRRRAARPPVRPGPGARTSGSASGCRARCRAARPSARWRALPGVVGAYAKRGGGALLATVGGFGFYFERRPPPSGPAADAARQPLAPGPGAARRSGIRPSGRSSWRRTIPAVTCPDAAAVRRALARDDLFTVVHDPFLSDTARYADLVLPATTYLETEDLFRAYGDVLPAVRAAGDAAAGRGLVQSSAWPRSWRGASA